MTKSNYGSSIVVGPATVRWSHLMSPDDKFGNPNHSVTIVVDDRIKKQLETATKQLGGKKINGFKVDAESGDNLVRFKNVLQARQGVKTFPILDSNDQPTQTVPFGTDVVRVKVTPALIERDKSVSFYMEKIQLVERNYQPGTSNSGMGAVSGGFVDGNTSSDSDEVPF